MDTKDNRLHERTMTVVTHCPFCQGMNPGVLVAPVDISDFQNGRKSAQRAMPYLTPAEREYLISGVCDDCWQKMEDEMENGEDEEYPDNEGEVDDEGRVRIRIRV